MGSRRGIMAIVFACMVMACGVGLPTATAETPRVSTQFTALERLAWASVSKSRPDTPSWNSANDAPVGRHLRAHTVYRSFFRIDLRPISGASVLWASLEQPVTAAASCEQESIEVWVTGDISGATTWNQQPAWETKVGTAVGSCPGHWLEIDLKQVVADALAAGKTELTFGLRTINESDHRGFKQVSNAPVISVQHNTAPDQPTELAMLSHLRPCGADRLWISNAGPELWARITDPDINETGGGDFVSGRFEWWHAGGEKIGESESWSGSSGSWFRVVIPENSLVDGGTYAWRVRGFDGVAAGPWSPWCEFTVDTVRPDRPPTVSSTDYPPTGEHGGVGVPGTFTFTANGVDDVVAFSYGRQDSPATVEADGPGGTATVTYTPTSPGWNVLWVRSIDRAGNRSDFFPYEFNVS